MGIFTNCEATTRRDCLRLGLGALSAAAWSTRLRLAGRGGAAPARRPTSCILIWMDGGPTHYETFDPKPRRPERDPRRVRADRHQGPRRPVLGAHEAAGGDRRQARRRPLDPPQPGEPRRRQPLHDDRRAAAHPGRLRRVRQLPPQPRLGRRPRARGLRRACRRTSRSRACRAPAGRTSWGRSTPRSSCPTTRTAPASASATSPCRAAWPTTGSIAAEISAPASIACSGSPTRRPATRPWRSTSTTSRATT